MTLVPLTFGVQSAPGRWGADGDNRLINAFAEDRGDEGKIRFPIVASPGSKLFGTAPNAGGIRGMLVTATALIVVAGPIVYLVDATGTFTQATGSGIPGTEPVFITRNRKAPYPEVVIVTSGNRFVLDTDPTAPTVSAIADTDLPPPIAAGFVDGYILYAIADGRMFNSDLENATSINALAFVTAEGAPDGGVSIGIRGREAFLFGEETTEVFGNDGSNNPSPFAPALSQFIPKGCGAAHSVTRFMGTLALIDHEGIPRIVEGYTFKRIGTVAQSSAVARAIHACSAKGEIVGTAFTIQGNEWLQFTCPGEFTWEFNGATGLWNERESYRQGSFRASHAVRFNDKIIMGDVENGKLYEIDPDTKDEAGDPLVMTPRAPIQHSYAHLKFKAFHADLIPGVGLVETGAETDNPRAMLRWSDDGSQTWSPTRLLEIGKIGEKRKRIKTTQLGKTGEDGRTWELSVSAAVCRGLTGAAVDVEQRRPV